MAHGLNSIIKREIDCGHHNSISVINKSSSLVGNSTTAALAAAAAVAATASSSVQQPTATSATTGGNSNNTTANNNNNTSGSASHSGAGNARMGSRRIFTPQFKLQVLESYRYDSECKGNQRATARKYGIHRRQIQKWLQSENSLRESAANCNNQNSVKHHQFHNINHHQMTVSAAPQTTTSSAIGATVGQTCAITAATATNTPGRSSVNTHTMSGAYVHNHNNNNNTLHHHRHSQYHQPPPPQSQPPYKTALDTARHSVALVPSPPTVAAPATVRLNSAPTKCMNGLPLTPATAAIHQTNTLSMLPTAYSQTPAIKPVPLIQRQHQSPLHQHHHHNHQLHQHHHHHQQQPRQHESVLMSSACLPDSEYSPMGAMQAHYENLHRPQAVYDYIRPYPHPPVVTQAPAPAAVVVVPPAGAPIDLSVGPKRPQCESAKSPANEAKWYQPPETNNNDTEHEIVRVKIEPMSPIACSTPNPSQAVDLTCRKRANHTTDPTTPPEKLPKTEDEATAEAAKPVKLFKPYLPDNEDPTPEKEPSPKSSDQKDAIIWSNHPSAPGNFQSPPSSDSAYTFPLGSPCSNSSLSSGISVGGKFQSSSPASSPQSPAAVSTSAASPTLLWCPKGSPVSGYDTASTYSDSSEHRPQPLHHPMSAFESRAATASSTYSLDVKMEALDTRYYQHDVTRGGVEDATRQSAPRSAFTSSHRPHHEVQRWLMDQQAATVPRPGIAVYV